MIKNWFCLGWAALLGGSALGLVACQQNGPPAVATATPTQAPHGLVAARSRPPVAHRLGKTDFYFSLPPGFALKTTDGPDFLVHYFAPAGTTLRADFTGGLHLGSYPQGDVADTTAGCRTRRAVVMWQGHPATFVVHRCATGYTISSVFDSYNGWGWDARANAFGEAKSAAGLRQLLAVFATLRRQPQPAP